jgi:hypothetical protein
VANQRLLLELPFVDLGRLRQIGPIDNFIAEILNQGRLDDLKIRGNVEIAWRAERGMTNLQYLPT